MLGGLPELQICTAYKVDGRELPSYRTDLQTLAAAEPVYETMPGWAGDVSGCRSYAELPAEARAYVERLERLCGAPVKMVSVGPERSATLMR